MVNPDRVKFWFVLCKANPELFAFSFIYLHPLLVLQVRLSFAGYSSLGLSSSPLRLLYHPHISMYLFLLH